MNASLIRQAHERLCEIGIPLGLRREILLGAKFWQGQILVVLDCTLPRETPFDPEAKLVGFVTTHNERNL